MDIITLALAKKYADEKLTNIDSSSAQSDWEQNDENAVDYIKNKPFGDTGEYEEIELLKDGLVYFTGFDKSWNVLMECPPLKANCNYKITVNGKEYNCTSKIVNSVISLGQTDYMITNEWEEDKEPFVFQATGSMAFCYIREGVASGNFYISISEYKPIIKLLDRKYIEDYLAGQKTTGQEYTYENEVYTSQTGAEIFNSSANIAIGLYSHAEGNGSVALGDYSHAEGSGDAIGIYSHAEGGAKAIGPYAHAEGILTEAIGQYSHTEGLGTKALRDLSHVEGWYNIANTSCLHVQGCFNIPEEDPKLYNYIWGLGQNIKYDGETIIYIYNSRPSLNKTTGVITAGEVTECTFKELKVGDNFSFTNNANSVIEYFLNASKFIGTEIDSETNNTLYSWTIQDLSAIESSGPGKYLHIVGNGTYEDKRSNAHTLETDGTAWFAGDVYVGSTSGVNRDEGSKKLATEDFVNEQISNVSSVQSDWNQNDESELDYIKNRPFYAGDPELTEIFNGNISFTNHTSFINHFSLLEGETYQVIWNDKEYFCTCQKSTIGANQFLCIGNTSLAETDSTQWIDGEPFLIQDGGFATIVNTSDDNSSCSTIVNIYKEYVKLLDRKFVSYIAGENVEGKIVTYNNQTYTCPTGAEIFNSSNNKAIGLYSHAEGHDTVAYGAWCHAEGTNTYVSGNGSHAEGQSTIVDGFGSHAEGANTKASGDYIHVEGYNTIASSNYQHVQGKYNVEDTEEKYAHIVGNGTENTSSNAHTLDWNGNAWYQGSVEATSIILSSPSGKRFNITVGDDGILTSTEIVLEE